MSDTIELASGSGVPEPDPAHKFLGVRASDATEFTLLGVAPGTATRDNVLTALRAQLARVAQHPDAGTPQAAQVRVMLHAAAARLLGSSLATEPAPAPASREATQTTEFERAALNILAMHGGMNHVSLKLIRQTAAGMGVDGDELSSVMLRLPQLVASAGDSGPAPARSPAAAAREARPVAPRREADTDQIATEGMRRVPVDDPTKRLVFMAAGAIAGGLVLLAGIGYGLRIIFTDKPAQPVAVTPPPTGPTPALATPDASIVQARPAPTAPPAQPAPARTAEELVTALRDGASKSRDDAPRGAAAVVDALREIGLTWHTMPRDYLVASGDAFVDAVYAVQHDDAALAGVLDALMDMASPTRDALDMAAGRTAQAVLARSLLARLQVERDLPVSARRTLRAAVEQGLVPENATRGPWAENLFDATGAVGRVLAQSGDQPSQLPPEEAWKTLVACIRAATPEAERQEAVFLTTLDHLMTAGKEPTQDARVLAGVQTLASALEWSPQRGARAALVVWLGRSDISSADAAALTAVVASKSEASADRTFALSPGASDQDRLDLRDRFANLWQTQTAGARRDLALSWVQEAQGALNAPLATGVADAMREAVRFASLNASAARVWRGDSATGAVLMPPDNGNGPTQADVYSRITARGSSQWALDYLRAGPDMLRRRDLLKAFSGEVTPLDAKLLVIDAMRGPTQEIRVQARRALAPAIGSPVVTAAMLDFAPSMPPTREASQLVQQATGRTLPGTRSPMWRVEVRRALVWKMLAHVDDGSLDDLTTVEGLLATVYEERLANRPAAGTITAVDAMARAYNEQTLDAQAATRMRGRTALVTNVRTMTRERLRAAAGAPQMFVAYSAGLVELLAVAVISERPLAADEVQSLLTQWRRDMAQSAHVVRQMELAERMQTRLWVLRMKEAS